MGNANQSYAHAHTSCSLQCFKIHKESPCEKPAAPSSSENLPGLPFTYKFPTADTVPLQMLEELGMPSFYPLAILSLL